MSVSGVSLSDSLSQTVQTWQARAQKIQTEFQQLGQDLQAGNLSQAQADFSTLSQNVPSTAQNNSAVAQAFNSLGSALQSGNLASAQQAYATFQQDALQAGQSQHHHHGGGGVQAAGSTTGGTLSQLFNTLGSALVSGNLSAAQSAYSALTTGISALGGKLASTATSAAAGVSFVG